MIEGQLDGDPAAHAVPGDVRTREGEHLEEGRHVGGHVPVGERPADVAGAAVALELDRYHLEVAGERGQQAGEAALDRPERAVEQDQRVPVAVAFAVQLQRAHVDVAAKARGSRGDLGGRDHARAR